MVVEEEGEEEGWRRVRGRGVAEEGQRRTGGGRRRERVGKHEKGSQGAILRHQQGGLGDQDPPPRLPFPRLQQKERVGETRIYSKYKKDPHRGDWASTAKLSQV